LLNKTFLSDYRYFPNIYISQGSVATRLSVVWSLMVTSLQVYCWVYWWKILKIDQHLAKLWAKAAFPVFWTHGVVVAAAAAVVAMGTCCWSEWV